MYTRMGTEPINRVTSEITYRQTSGHQPAKGRWALIVGWVAAVVTLVTFLLGTEEIAPRWTERIHDPTWRDAISSVIELISQLGRCLVVVCCIKQSSGLGTLLDGGYELQSLERNRVLLVGGACSWLLCVFFSFYELRLAEWSPWSMAKALSGVAAHVTWGVFVYHLLRISLFGDLSAARSSTLRLLQVVCLLRVLLLSFEPLFTPVGYCRLLYTTKSSLSRCLVLGMLAGDSVFHCYALIRIGAPEDWGQPPQKARQTFLIPYHLIEGSEFMRLTLLACTMIAIDFIGYSTLPRQTGSLTALLPQIGEGVLLGGLALFLVHVFRRTLKVWYWSFDTRLLMFTTITACALQLCNIYNPPQCHQAHIAISSRQETVTTVSRVASAVFIFCQAVVLSYRRREDPVLLLIPERWIPFLYVINSVWMVYGLSIQGCHVDGIITAHFGPEIDRKPPVLQRFFIAFFWAMLLNQLVVLRFLSESYWDVVEAVATPTSRPKRPSIRRDVAH